MKDGDPLGMGDEIDQRIAATTANLNNSIDRYQNICCKRKSELVSAQGSPLLMKKS